MPGMLLARADLWGATLAFQVAVRVLGLISRNALRLPRHSLTFRVSAVFFLGVYVGTMACLGLAGRSSQALWLLPRVTAQRPRSVAVTRQTARMRMDRYPDFSSLRSLQ